MAPLLFLSIQNRSGRECSRMANSSALPFPIPSGAGESPSGPRDVVPLDGGIRDCGSEVPCHIVDGELESKDLVQRKRRNKVLRGFVHQVRRVGAPKRAKDLVQEKRKNKVLRELLHQVRGVGAPKKTKDLVQGKRRNKGLRESLHQVRSRGAAHH